MRNRSRRYSPAAVLLLLVVVFDNDDVLPLLLVEVVMVDCCCFVGDDFFEAAAILLLLLADIFDTICIDCIINVALLLDLSCLSITGPLLRLWYNTNSRTLDFIPFFGIKCCAHFSPQISKYFYPKKRDKIALTAYSYPLSPSK